MNPVPLSAADLDAIDTLRPTDWSPFRATFERYLTLACCTPYGLKQEGRLIAMGTLIHFGSSAWIAQLITLPEMRGRGWGSRMLGFLVDEGRRRGCGTFSLVATEEGFPLYAKAGFRVEGFYAFWTRNDPAPAEPEASRELLPWDQESKTDWALDRWVSGETRESYFQGRTETGLQAPGGRKDGFFLPGVGEGLVVASTDQAGIPLLHRRIDGSSRVVVPEENAAAQTVLQSRGFEEHHRARRMVLGRSLTRNPQGLWSRIGGNLG